MNLSRTGSAGNALFLILIAVALFAALSYAVTRSGRGGGGTQKEEASLLASQIMQDAALIQQAYNRLRALGCSTVQIDLDENPANADRRNPLSPSASGDFSCALFHQDGGAQTTERLPDKIFLDALPSIFRRWRQASSLRVDGLGTNLAELSIVLRGLVRLDVCQAINRGLIGTSDLPVLVSNLDDRPYDGTTAVWDPLTDPLAVGRDVLCIDTDSSGLGVGPASRTHTKAH